MPIPADCIRATVMLNTPRLRFGEGVYINRCRRYADGWRGFFSSSMGSMKTYEAYNPSTNESIPVDGWEWGRELSRKEVEAYHR